MPLALIGGFAAWWRYRGSRGHERLQLALWAGWVLTYGVLFSAAAGLPSAIPSCYAGRLAGIPAREAIAFT
jgi:hypothetical protein